MRRKFLLVVMMVGMALSACAQVPREAVELSTTVGKDLAQVHEAHVNLAHVLFDRMKSDVNSFVDDVYTPYFINKHLQAEQNDFELGKESLFGTLDKAIKHPDNAEYQSDAIAYMEVVVSTIHDNVELYRKKRLKPILDQEKEALTEINKSYMRIHYANSIVTGHLASVAKVYDAQEEVLNQMGVEGLREKIGSRLAKTSESVRDIVEKARKVDVKAQSIQEKVNGFTLQLDTVLHRK